MTQLDDFTYPEAALGQCPNLGGGEWGTDYFITSTAKDNLRCSRCKAG